MAQGRKYLNLHEIVREARLNLNDTNWDYLVGGTETETTLRRNRLAIDRKALLPRVLNDVSNVDHSGVVLGQQLSLPVMLAPIGSLQVFEAGGGASAAAAAGDSDIMSFASSVCEPSIEDIAAASNAPKVYQLYIRGDDSWVDDHIERAMAAGYIGLCLTVDTPVVSRRERDTAKRVIPTSMASPGDISYQATMSWKTVDRIRQKYDFPLILKGINRTDDALRALDHGISMIYVSNHGGRQLDQSVATLDLLPEIVEAVAGRAEIAIDGGFYRGTDLLKAYALGANAVGLGRLEAWAMAAGGRDALNQAIKILKRETRIAMALCGVTKLSELDPSFVREADVATQSDVLSAFPLLDQGY